MLTEANLQLLWMILGAVSLVMPERNPTVILRINGKVLEVRRMEKNRTVVAVP